LKNRPCSKGIATSVSTPSSIPVFFFAEMVEHNIDEAIDPAYEAWVDMAQQGYYC
jgi:hypothetical protein